MDFRILGPVEVFAEGQPLPLGGQRPRALLAYLLLHANDVVAADRLISELWFEAPRGGVAALQTQISRLRRLLGDRILTSGAGYVLRVEPGELDLDRFRLLLAEAGADSDPAKRSRRLREADALWRGVPLGGLDVPFAVVEAGALEELRLAALEDRLEADLELGHNGELVSELSTLVAHHPLRERLRGQLILALYRSGRQADALEAYRETRRMLNDELGLEPGPALRELEQAILRHDPGLVRAAATSPAPPPLVAQAARRRVALVAAGLVTLGLAAVAAAVAWTDDGTKQVMSTLTVRTRAAPTVTTRAVQPARRNHVRAQPRLVRHTIAAKTRTTAVTPPAVQSAPASRTTTLTAAKPPAAPRQATAAPKNPVATTTTATTTTPKVKPKPPAPKTVTISDAFHGDVIDPSIWHQVVSDANVTLAQQNDSLVVTVGAGAVRTGAYNQIDGHVGTQCSFPGDFDARVDFALLEWPPAANILIGLNAIYIGSFAGRQNGSQSGDSYSGWVGTHFGAVPLVDTSGSLRIARVNGIVTSYFWHNGGWSRLTSGTSVGTVVLGLAAQSSSADQEFSHQEVKVAFDNFVVRGVRPIGQCLTG
jgi:DNA-binding SARP family transcriptional activator